MDTMPRIKSRSRRIKDIERVKTEHGVLNFAPKVVDLILSKTRTRKISLKLRTILVYSYIAYRLKTLDLNMLRGLMARVRPPGYLSNQYFYEDIRKRLEMEYGDKVEFIKRRRRWYAVFARA